jgi:DNA-binding MarR family transcriptional regulator
MKQKELTLVLAERDLVDARRILALVTRAGERHGIMNGARKIDAGPSDSSDDDSHEKLARRMFAARKARDELLPDYLSAQPAWDILLALYLADRAGARHSIGRMIELSRSSVTTGLRHIDILEAQGLVKREQDKRDGRIFYLLLCARGREAVDKILAAALAD